MQLVFAPWSRKSILRILAESPPRSHFRYDGTRHGAMHVTIQTRSKVVCAFSRCQERHKPGNVICTKARECRWHRMLSRGCVQVGPPASRRCISFSENWVRVAAAAERAADEPAFGSWID